MRLFRKRPDHRAVLKHAVNIATGAALEDTEEARQKAADHIVTDLRGLSRGTLIRAAALAAMLEGDARAAHIKHAAEHMFSDLVHLLEQEDAEAAAEAPEGQEPLDDPADPSAADEGPAAGWSEDRR